MSGKKDSAAVVGVGVAACAVCCAGPILGFLAAIGLGTAVGFALFGVVAVGIGAAVAALLLVRRRRQAVTCAPSDAAEPVPVALGKTSTQS